jgi:hypothetical protein
MIKYFEWKVLLANGECGTLTGTHTTTTDGILSVFDEDGLVHAIQKNRWLDVYRKEEVEPGWKERVKRLMQTGHTLKAVRLYRDYVDVGLKEAKTACEEMIQ